MDVLELCVSVFLLVVSFHSTESQVNPQEFLNNYCDQLDVINEGVSGQVTSPQYPGNYPRSTKRGHCLAVRQAEVSIILEVTSLDLEDSSGCAADNVSIYTETKDFTLTAILCGNDLTQMPKLDAGRAALLQFWSNNETEGQGFVIKYSTKQKEIEHDRDSDRHDDGDGSGRSNNWGVVIIVVFSVLIAAMVGATVTICIFHRRHKAAKVVKFSGDVVEPSGVAKNV
ncbi:CUBN-like protein [Mya arenaria]|uniref:CUBN-like protein n=1 Tax=Mya arenaria TaxID=6604 RepID=A0ABY7DQ06_MYAAR|nr:uncharacterized protein LOC128225703 [Mya arenaria]WAQ98173.1 CUBN-like protein [Mya arenaria]